MELKASPFRHTVFRFHLGYSWKIVNVATQAHDDIIQAAGLSMQRCVLRRTSLLLHTLLNS